MAESKNKKKTLSSAFLLQRYCQWLEKWNVAILLFCLVTGVLGTYYTVQLYKNLKTDLEELLPENAESVLHLKATLGRVEGLNHISIIVESSDGNANQKFVDDLVVELRKLPKDLIARVEYNLNPIRDFFIQHKQLYMDLKDWHLAEDYIRVRKGYKLQGKDSAEILKEFEDILKKYKEKANNSDQFPGGYFSSKDRKTFVVLGFQTGKLTAVETSNKISKVCHEIVAQMNPKKYAPDMVVGFNGDVQNMVEEHHGLMEDLILSFVVVSILVAVALLLYYRSFFTVYALCSTLFAATFWTFGVSYWLVGYLNANTAFMGSIVLGNGINFGVIFLARYLEERSTRKGSAQVALIRSMGATTGATVTAALAAGFSYLSLMFTDFRGFSQFGIIGGLGMALCWGASYTMLPAFLIWGEKRKLVKVKKVRVGDYDKSKILTFVSYFIKKFYKPIVVFSALSIFVSGYYAYHLLTSNKTIETDFSKLRHKYSIEHGSGFWGKKVDAVFGRYLTPTLILTQSPLDSEKVVRALRELKERDGDNSPISEVKRVEDFLPANQAAKLRIIERLQDQLHPKIIARLPLADQKLVNDFLPREKLKEIQVTDLPESLRVHFTEANGNIGNMVHVYPRLPGNEDPKTQVKRELDEKEKKASFWDASEITRFTELLRASIRIAAVPAYIAGQPPLSSDMIQSISKDGPKATFFAFMAVLALVLMLFPKWILARSVLAGLLLGILWMLGVMGAWNLKINFLNFIALPITFGIGVDYAVNIFSRHRLDPRSSITKIIETTGGAVVLCSITTSIGYGSLLLAGNQAFVSFGILAVLGEVTCLVAALIVLPAFWIYTEGEHKA